MYINIILKSMDNFNVLKSEKFNVGKIQKQRINITQQNQKKFKYFIKIQMDIQYTIFNQMY